MSDPLTDPRAVKLLSALPGEIEALGQRCTLLACQAHDTGAGVRGAAGQAQWTGDAANIFRHWATKLPANLDHMYSAYSSASNALDNYAMNLTGLQQRFTALVAELKGAQATLNQATGGLANANQALTQASIAQPMLNGLTGVPQINPQAGLANAQDAVSAATGAVNHAQDQLHQLQQQAFKVLDQFDTDRGQATHGLISAIELMPQNQETLPQTTADKVIMGLGPGIVDAAKRLPGDFQKVYDTGGDPKALAQLGADFGTVVGTVGLAAAVLLCPVDAAGAVGAAEVLATAGRAAGVAGNGALAVQTAGDIGQLENGQGDVYALAGDGASAVIGQTGLRGTAAANSAAADLQAQSAAINAVAKGEHFTGLGADPRLAGVDIHDPAARAAFAAATSAERQAANTEARRIGALNAALHYGEIKAKTDARNQVDPTPAAP